MKPRHIPNILTVLRILMVIPAAIGILGEAYALALLTFALAAATDGLDGWLARHYGWTSRLGAILDPLADKLLLMTSFVCLGWIGLVPVWLVALVVGRDLVIIAGFLAYEHLIAPVKLAPTRISKLNTLAQIALVLAAMGQAMGYPLWPWLSDLLLWGVALGALITGGNYVWCWSRRARAAKARVRD